MDAQLQQQLDELSAGSDQRYGEEYLVFETDAGNMFAMVHLGTRPQQVDLRCDYLLAKELIDRYESVMPARKLDPRLWLSVLITPQLEDGLTEDLLRQAVVQANAD
jgi:predicted DNA-binding protein (MmcQ/YjbR family)